MSEATADPATTPADVEAPAADPAAERAEDRRRLSEHARVHLLYVMGAVTLWGAADAWATQSGWALASVVATVNALIAAFVIPSVLHEWGHLAGARLAGAHSPALAERVNHFFLFDFPFDKNDGRQFVWMSWGGILVPWLLVLGIALTVPIDTVPRIALLAAFVARAAQVSIFEGPITLRAMGGGDPRTELGRGLSTLKPSRNQGNAVGLAVALLLWLVA